MSWIYKLQRKFGHLAIPNLMFYLIILNVIGFVIYQANPAFFMQYLAFYPHAVMEGEVWRLFTFLLTPPDSRLFMFLLYMYLYYSLGNTLERVWGSFVFNLYVLIGILGHILGSMVIYWMTSISGLYDLSYLYMSMLLWFAATFPDAQILFYFFIPIKAKWFAIFECVWYAYAMLTGGPITRVMILLSLANFIIFFLSMYGKKMRQAPKASARKAAYQRQVYQAAPKRGEARHRCAVCGRTELDDENLEFRYCSQCDGQYEYCMEHLYTHKHVKHDEH